MSSSNYVSESFSRFFARACDELTSAGIKVELLPEFTTKGDINGSYDGKVLTVGMNGRNQSWTTLFLHEYCHFLQDQDTGRKSHPWADLSEEDLERMWRSLETDSWWARITGKVMSDFELKVALRKAQLMEQDCDRRALTLIRRYGLGIDLVAYIKEANAYHMFYSVLAITKNWETDCYAPEILARMPARLFTEKELEVVPDSLLRLYRNAEN